MNIRRRLQLAGNALLAMLEPEHDLMPMGGYEAAHDLGRWWDAMLRLEEAIGFVIPPELEAASLRNLQFLTANPDRLLMNRLDVPWLKEKAKINPHNFRESLLAFGGLVRCRHSAWAHEAGLQLVRAMDRCLRADGTFDYTKLSAWGHVPNTEDPAMAEAKRDGWFDGTTTGGRSIEALVWLYEATNEPLVLDLARRLAEHHLAFSTSPDGAARAELVSPDNVGHTHSYQGTLRGLLLFGLLTRQRQYVDVVEATYRNAIRNRIVRESGWVAHDLGKSRYTNEHGDPVAEQASAGDAAQLALWLALYADRHDLFDDVERYVRARLLPTQLTNANEVEDPKRQVALREVGAWTFHYTCHAGKGCMPDVVAAVTHSLCDIYRHVCTQTQTGTRINLHVDYEDPRLRVTSRRGSRGILSVVVKQANDIMIRIPGWAPEASLRLSVDGKRAPVKRLGTYAWVAREALAAQSRIMLSYALPTRRTEEHMPSGRCFTFAWRGDEIVGVSPQEHPDPFYPAMTEADDDGDGRRRRRRRMLKREGRAGKDG